MEIDIHTLKHAYLLEGDINAGEEYLEALIKRLGIFKEQNPDYYVFQNASFTIDEARNLTSMARSKAFGTRKIFVITSSRYTPEAQNALLKTLEEPVDNTHFFLILSERNLLLPTLLSRVEIIRLFHSSRTKNTDALDFLNSTPPERLVFSKKFIDKEKPLVPFIDSILIVLKDKGASIEDLDTVYKLRLFADDPAVMPRLILEHLSLALR